MNEDASDARNTASAFISEGSPARPIGVITGSNSFTFGSSSGFAPISVRM